MNIVTSTDIRKQRVEVQRLRASRAFTDKAQQRRVIRRAEEKLSELERSYKPSVWKASDL